MRIRIVRWVNAALLIAAVGEAAAQQPAARARPVLATLPESNEALILSDRVDEALSAGDYRLAIELVDQISALPGALVGAPGSRTYFPVWHQAARLLSQFPAEGVELYRSLYDAEVTARFDAARSRLDLAELQTLFRRYRLSTAWPRIGIELADLLLDAGRFTEAMQIADELCRATPDDPAPHWRLAAALAVTSHREGAARHMEIAARLDGNGGGAPGAALRSWLEAEIADGPDTAWTLSPRIGSALSWTRPVSGAPSAASWSQELAEQISASRRMPLLEPRFVDDRVVVRLFGQILAFDALTLVELWRVREATSGPVSPDSSGETPPDPTTLIDDHLRHTLSVGFGRAFTIEGLPELGAQSELDLMHRPFRAAPEGAQRNELVARDLSSGAIAWRTGTDAGGILYDVSFQDRPLALGERLIASYVRNGSLCVGELSPADGRVLREAEIVGPPTRFPPEGGAGLITSDDTAIYVSTGNGVIAALSPSDLSWKWATVYPSTVARERGQPWWHPVETPERYGIERPQIVGDVLVVAPIDSTEILGLDRFEGHERWRVARGEHSALVGGVGAGVVFAGHRLTCLSAAQPDPQSPLWRSAPLELTGRPAILGERIYVPSRGGLVVVDGRTGKLLCVEQFERHGAQDDRHTASDFDAWEFPRAADGLSTAIVVAPDAIVAVGPRGLTRYADFDATRRRCESLADAPAEAVRGAFGLAWLAALEGDYDGSIHQLDALAAAGPGLTEARDELYSQLFERLSDEAGDIASELDWLRQAAARAHDRAAAQRLQVLIGRRLDRAGDPGAAIAHHAELVLLGDSVALDDPDDPRRRIQTWLLAADRLREQLAQAAEPAALAVFERCVADASAEGKTLRLLERLGECATTPEHRRLIERAVLDMVDAPPERAILLLAGDAGADVSIGERRRLALARWDVHASLGMLDEAARDQAAWRTDFAEGASAEQQRRAQQIELAQRKLTAATPPPFSEHLQRQWRLANCELVIDVGNPERAARDWIVVRNNEKRQIELRRAVSDGFPLRESPDALGSPSAAIEAPGPDLRRIAWEGPERAAWPAAIHGSMAAVATPGGLIGMGLGPERYGGRLRWDHPIAAWEAIPLHFEQECVVSDSGAHVLARPDRVLCLGWGNGELRWQRDFPGVRLVRLLSCGEWLAAVGDDLSLWLMRASSGGELRRFTPPSGSIRAVDAVSGALLVWTDAALVRVSPETLTAVWSTPTAPAFVRHVAQAEGWVAWRTRDESTWQVAEADSGAPVTASGLRDVGVITAMAGDGDRVYVGGLLPPAGHESQAMSVRLSVHSRRDGSLLWSHDFRTRVAINPTQLSGHPRFIPLLLDWRDVDSDAGEGGDGPRLQLVDKMDGTLTAPRSLRDDYAAQDSACDVYMLVTPQRIVVQLGGNVIGYGSSVLSTTP